jgi:hypothetical protein
MYSSKHSARWGWVVTAVLRMIYSRDRPDIRCIGGWVGPIANLDGCRNCCPRWDSVQPVARGYTDYAILAHPIRWVEENKLFVNKSFMCLSVMNIGIFGTWSLTFWWKIRTLWEIFLGNLVWQSKLQILYLSTNWRWLLLTGNTDMCTPVLWTVGDALVLA